MSEDLILQEDVMKMLGIKSRSALWNMRKKHKFPEPILLSPSRYSKKAIEEWINNGGVNPRS